MNKWTWLFVAVFSLSIVGAFACGGDGDEDCTESTENVEESSPSVENGCGCS